MKTQYFKCSNCNGIVCFDSGYCENCGANIGYKQVILNKNAKLFNNHPRNETKVEQAVLLSALSHEVNLNRKEIMIALNRLVDMELRIEAIENKLRG